MFAKSVIVALLGASVAQAHMIMTNPVPYSKDSLNNSPLAADGSDFPCKLRSNTFDVTKENTMSIGETQNMTFQGSATHGGGSCQISLTTDRQPTKDSEWKVIKSFEGGCPANVDGNLSGGETAADPDQFEFSIPDGIEAGKYTLAWTWFNRIGNREMYMNCAPLTVEGGSSKRSEPEEKEKRSSSFPPMFVANVNGCTTKESVDIRFPNPGDDVEYLGQPSNLAPKGSTACTGNPTFGGAGNTAGGSSSGGSDSGSGSSSGSGSGSSSAAPAPTSSAAPAPSSAPAPVETTPAAPAAPQPAATSSAPASPSSSGSSSGSSGSAESGSCSPEGSWNCIGGSTFQRCASGQWTSPQQMASGTTCTAGQGSELSVKAALGARAVSEMRFRKRIIGSHHA